MSFFDDIGKSFNDFGKIVENGTADMGNAVNNTVGKEVIDWGYTVDNGTKEAFSQSNLDAFGQQLLGGVNSFGQGLGYVAPFLPGGGGLMNLNKKKASASSSTTQTAQVDNSIYFYGLIGVVGVVILLKMKK